jgi:UDP-N-acetylmuramoyl-tripeptide--D-alanyl-D-alanine ligase
VEGRGLYHRQPWRDGEIVLVDETYNANPASVEAALKALMLTPTQGRRIAILGDMRELGEYALEFHQNLAPTLHGSNIDLVCTCGVHMAELNKALPLSMRGPHVATSEQMVEKVNMIIQPGDTVMIKGSRGMRMETILHDLLKGAPQC